MVDHTLVYEAQKFITAENVHRVNTWIFCYMMSTPDSPVQCRYKELLRQFVNKQKLKLVDRIQASFPGNAA